MPAPSYPLPDTDEGRSYAMGFAVPVATPGLRLIARPSLAPASVRRSDILDWPLSARFDETDCLVVFDNVLVPWERVFICRDIERCNAIYPESAAFPHMAHQFAIKDLAKAEFMMGLAFALAQATNVDVHQHIQGHLSDVINSTEVVRACIMASEAEARVSPSGAIAPSAVPLQCIRFLFPQMFARMTEAIRIIGAGGLFMVPSMAEFDGERAADVRRFAQAANADARTRTALFRLAYDATLSSFAGRQQLYERYFAGDPVRAAGFHYKSYDKAPYLARVDAVLADLDKRARGDTRS
jgi:4-hydroxyphenylacetate 3-monooxygenase